MTHKLDYVNADITQATTDRKRKFWQSPDFPRRVAGALVYSLLLIAGFYGLMTLVDMEDTKYRSTFSKWPTVSGTVISTARGEAEVWDRELGNLKTPTLTITFTYVVQGVTYQGSQSWRFNASPFDDRRKEMETKHPIGSSVTVYYDSTRPDRCLIDTTAIDASGTLGFWLGVILLYLGIFGFISLVYVWGWWIRDK